MARKSQGFKDRFLSKIGKIDRLDLRAYLDRLLSQNQFLELVFDHLDEAILVTDEKIRIIYSNSVARRMLAWPPQRAFQGEPLAEHCPEGPLKDTIREMTRRPRAIEGYESPFGEDDERRVMLKALPVRAPEAGEGEDAAEGTLWVFLLRDVTERYRSIEAQARAQRLASLALLTSGVAHEIKNPLNSLNIHAQILERAADERGGLEPEKVKRAAGVILEETARLTTIVNEFIQAARPARPNMERASLNELVHEVARSLEAECARAEVEFKLDLDADLPPIEMDPHLIFQALRNLARNALEAHQGAAPDAAREAPPTIQIRTKLAGDRVALEVADNGPGIPEENLDKIFEPYYTTKFSGTGLGLMVVYRIVTQHGGHIHVQSRPGVGTRFLITIPLSERPVRMLDQPADAEPAIPA